MPKYETWGFGITDNILPVILQCLWFSPHKHVWKILCNIKEHSFYHRKHNWWVMQQKIHHFYKSLSRYNGFFLHHLVMAVPALYSCLHVFEKVIWTKVFKHNTLQDTNTLTKIMQSCPRLLLNLAVIKDQCLETRRTCSMLPICRQCPVTPSLHTVQKIEFETNWNGSFVSKFNNKVKYLLSESSQLNFNFPGSK